MERLHRLIVPLVAVLVVQTLSLIAEGGKLRVLALHGYNENAASFCQVLATWDQSILKLMDLNCLNAPFQDKNAGKDQFTWLNTEDWSHSGSRRDESLAYILDYMHKTGPYDGILGFSLGGIMAGLVTGVQDKKMVILGRKSGDIPALRFAIIDEGGFLKGFMDEVFDPPLTTKSFHIIGNYDSNHQIEADFLPKWKNPTVAWINMPHAYLTSQYMDDNFKWRLENFLQSL